MLKQKHRCIVGSGVLRTALFRSHTRAGFPCGLGSTLVSGALEKQCSKQGPATACLPAARSVVLRSAFSTLRLINTPPQTHRRCVCLRRRPPSHLLEHRATSPRAPLSSAVTSASAARSVRPQGTSDKRTNRDDFTMAAVEALQKGAHPEACSALLLTDKCTWADRASTDERSAVSGLPLSATRAVEGVDASGSGLTSSHRANVWPPHCCREPTTLASAQARSKVNTTKTAVCF
ncbi:hypothetical protein AAFF_G00167610 [Aldrovandia affinis]|uniref:Uncharacterized protein n=1 Tax=Aldrovandia affinis TaxID=143900 RepID=A0AAD7RM92_9TELE|nr:hypothetical protein AAFF_G00167610 [Aldrovandia affinis]